MKARWEWVAACWVVWCVGVQVVAYLRYRAWRRYWGVG